VTTYSASQLSKLDECERAWGWRYIAGIKTPTHPAAALGTEVDDTQLQPYLREDRPLDFSRESGHIAASALAFLPPPKHPGLEVQRHFEFSSPSEEGRDLEVRFQGYVDLWLPKGGLPLPDGVPPLVNGRVPPIVSDFKTTSDIGKWAKSPAVLSTDPQAMIYAFWAMWETRSPVVDLVWIYMQTRGARKSARKHLRIDSSHVATQMMRLDSKAIYAETLKRTVTDPLALKANPDQCEAYGGCPYRSMCNLGPGEIADARAARERNRRGAEYVSQPIQTAGLLAKMKAKKAEVTGTPVADVPAPAPAVEVLGINPPEAKLPPAPLETDVPMPSPEELATVAAPAKAPRASKKKAEEAPAVAVSAPADGAAVSITWGRECLQVEPYNNVEVGPFSAEVRARSGESYADACARAYAELEKFAEGVRARKLASFAKALAEVKP